MDIVTDLQKKISILEQKLINTESRYANRNNMVKICESERVKICEQLLKMGMILDGDGNILVRQKAQEEINENETRINTL